jgi:hypothetical protein
MDGFSCSAVMKIRFALLVDFALSGPTCYCATFGQPTITSEHLHTFFSLCPSACHPVRTMFIISQTFYANTECHLQSDLF